MCAGANTIPLKVTAVRESPARAAQNSQLPNTPSINTSSSVGGPVSGNPNQPSPKCVWGNDNQSCVRASRVGSKYCLGHDPGVKDPTQLLEAMRAELNDAAQPVLNLEGWIFPADKDAFIILKGQTFEKPVSLKGAVFQGDLYFEDAKFRQNVNFDGAQFEGEAIFTRAEFGSSDEDFTRLTTFDQAQFVKAVNFKGAKFFQDASFINSCFGDAVDLDKDTEFRGETLFKKTKFKGEANLSEANFGGVTEFEDAHFEGAAKFISAKFGQQALLKGAVFVKLVEFSHAEFKNVARFAGARFQERAVFEGTKFLPGGDADFDRAKFEGSVSFKKAEFDRATYFTDTNFSQKTEFEGTKFNGNATFVKTVLNEVYFKATKFKQTSKFDRAQFGDAEFTSAEFCGELIFNRPQFSKLTVLDGTTFCGEAEFNVQVGARNLLAFRNANLTRARFGESNVENIDFENVEWLETEIYRLRIADEPEVRAFRRAGDEIRKLEQARRLYRQLRLNYDKVGEYEKAGRFYVSESEMSYLLLPPVYRRIHPRGLYKMASRYGESVLQAALGMVGLVIIFALAYWLISVVSPLSFKDTPKPLGAGFSGKLSLWEAVWFSLQASKPLADLGLSPNTPVYWLIFAEGLIVPTQVALFLLAIRRRFRRGD